MNQIIILIFLIISHIIIVSNACFTFKNSTHDICNTYVRCFIENPYIKINKIQCEPHSRRQLHLTMHNIDVMENFFLYNTETVDNLFNLFYNDSYTLLYIHIKNGSSSKLNRFKINNQWLKELFGRYKKFYSVFILNVIYKCLPQIRITHTDLMEIVEPKSLIWLQFNTSTGFCSIQIRTNQIRSNLYNCKHFKKHAMIKLMIKMI